MDWVLVLAALSAGLVGGRVACPIVRCSTGLAPGVCFSRDSDTYDVSLQSCPQNQTCEFNQMSSSGSYNFNQDEQYCHPSSWLPTKKFPGETCLRPQDCLSGNCAGVCVGLQAGSTCSDYADCAPGLICTNRACVQQASLGGICNTSDDCANNCLCFQQKCSLYFSLADGTAGVRDSFLCQSGYSENGECKPGPGNKNPPDSPC